MTVRNQRSSWVGFPRLKNPNLIKVGAPPTTRRGWVMESPSSRYFELLNVQGEMV